MVSKAVLRDSARLVRHIYISVRGLRVDQKTALHSFALRARMFSVAFKQAAMARLEAEWRWRQACALDARRETLYGWRDAFCAEGLVGLSHKRRGFAELERVAGRKQMGFDFFRKPYRCLRPRQTHCRPRWAPHGAHPSAGPG